MQGYMDGETMQVRLAFATTAEDLQPTITFPGSLQHVNLVFRFAKGQCPLQSHSRHCDLLARVVHQAVVQCKVMQNQIMVVA